jgi:hypothetical protein
VQSSTGTTAAGYAGAGSNDLGASYLFGGGDLWRWETDVRLPTLSNGTDTYTVRAGFFDAPNTDGTDGCFFKYSSGVNGGAWEGDCRNNSTVSTCNTTITVAAATWYRLTVVVTSSTSADFYVNGTLKCTVSTNIPNGAGRTTSWNVDIVKSLGTTARTMDIDYVEINAQLGTSR